MYGSRFLVISVLAATLVGALCCYEYYSDIAAWNQVQLSLTRLTSGIRFEPIITLRSKIADTDAAIRTYQSSFHVFPAGHEARLQRGIRGLQYLGIAIDNAEDVNSWNDMSKYPEVTKFVPRTCNADDLIFPKESIKNAFAMMGSSLVKEAAGEADEKEIQTRTLGFYPVLDLAKETKGCKERHDAATKISDEKKKEAYAVHLAKWKYHIDVLNPSTCLINAYTDGQEVAPSVAARFHLDANKEAHLDGVFCSEESPDRLISVTVNGAKFKPDWESDGGVAYSAMLVSASDSGRMPKPPSTDNRVSASGVQTERSRIIVGGSVQQTKIVRQVQPVYPPIAKSAHIMGTIVLHAIIANDGSVQKVEYLAGPPLLMKSAMDAVQQWRYEPTLINNKPVEVDTTVSVVFTLGG
jgi:TonB family protein